MSETSIFKTIILVLSTQQRQPLAQCRTIASLLTVSIFVARYQRLPGMWRTTGNCTVTCSSKNHWRCCAPQKKHLRDGEDARRRIRGIGRGVKAAGVARGRALKKQAPLMRGQVLHKNGTRWKVSITACANYTWLSTPFHHLKGNLLRTSSAP